MILTKPIEVIRDLNSLLTIVLRMTNINDTPAIF